MKATANAARAAPPDDTQHESIEDVLARLYAQHADLFTSGTLQHRSRCRPNALTEETVSPLRRLLGYLRGITPLPVELPAGEACRGER